MAYHWQSLFRRTPWPTRTIRLGALLLVAGLLVTMLAGDQGVAAQVSPNDGPERQPTLARQVRDSLEALRSGSQTVRRRGEAVLTRLGEAAVPTLLALYPSMPTPVRLEILSFIRAYPSPECTAFVCGLFLDPEAPSRESAMAGRIAWSYPWSLLSPVVAERLARLETAATAAQQPTDGEAVGPEDTHPAVRAHWFALAQVLRAIGRHQDRSRIDAVLAWQPPAAASPVLWDLWQGVVIHLGLTQALQVGDRVARLSLPTGVGEAIREALTAYRDQALNLRDLTHPRWSPRLRAQRLLVRMVAEQPLLGVAMAFHADVDTRNLVIGRALPTDRPGAVLMLLAGLNEAVTYHAALSRLIEAGPIAPAMLRQVADLSPHADRQLLQDLSRRTTPPVLLDRLRRVQQATRERLPAAFFTDTVHSRRGAITFSTWLNSYLMLSEPLQHWQTWWQENGEEFLALPAE